MKKELIIFDYANKKEAYWYKNTTDNAFTLLSDFNEFARIEGVNKIVFNFSQLTKTHSDSSILGRSDLFTIDKSAIAQYIQQDIKNNQEWYLYQLRQALFVRWYDKSEYHKNMLNKDPLIDKATAFLTHPEQISKIVNPK